MVCRVVTAGLIIVLLLKQPVDCCSNKLSFLVRVQMTLQERVCNHVGVYTIWLQNTRDAQLLRRFVDSLQVVFTKRLWGTSYQLKCYYVLFSVKSVKILNLFMFKIWHVLGLLSQIGFFVLLFIFVKSLNPSVTLTDFANINECHTKAMTVLCTHNEGGGRYWGWTFYNEFVWRFYFDTCLHFLSRFFYPR